MTKRLFKLFLMIVPFITAQSSYAYDFEVDGLYYTIESTTENTVSLTYKESVKVNGYYAGYNDYDKEELIIPSTVEYSGRTLSVIGINIQAFEYNTNIKKLVIPNTILWIHQECFYGCTSLESVEFVDGDEPLNLQLKGRTAYFDNCPITKMHLGREVILPQSQYAASPFVNLTSLINLSFSENVKTLCSGMFSGCTALEQVTLPNSCTSIGAGAFSSCKNLQSIDFGDNFEGIGGGAFLSCSSLTRIDAPYLTTLGANAFNGCTSLQAVELGNKLTEIPETAFFGCSELTEITLPETIQSIKANAFENCTSLESFTFPRSLTYVGNQILTGCTSIKTLTFDYNKAPLLLNATFLGKGSENTYVEHVIINRDLTSGSFSLSPL